MRILVLSGGYSAERDVSLSTGALAASALRRLGHRVAVCDLFLGLPAVTDLSAQFTADDTASSTAIASSEPDLDALTASRIGGFGHIGDNVFELARASDLVFLALHGTDGEDGKIQAALDLLGVRYTGTGLFGSALAMNKSAAKDVLGAHGILVPQGVALHRGDTADVGFPCVVKPCSGGSSVGTSIVTDGADYAAALEAAFRYDDTVLVEQYIAGREVDVGVVDGVALPPIEIVVPQGFYDYTSKYQAGLATEICPADFTPEITAKLRRAAEDVFRALRLEVYARMDFIVTDAGEVYCLEANTLPGLTPTSLLPQEAAAIGLTYDALIARIVELSLEKYGDAL
ncbi:MAG: D-alanine--D-alanine ligase [Oscillospiraceae bacterium]|jgi:D-alanine-D-alanine ligase|nr:D-alanine--D-alanine ligase [Oscillospiraceae bacterium]